MMPQSGRAERRPNGGRELVVEIMSADCDLRLSLQDLHERTRATVARFGSDMSGWPAELAPFFQGRLSVLRRWLRTDDHGNPYEFILVDCGAFDLFAGVGTRRQLNLADSRSGNLCTEVLLEALGLPSDEDPDEPLYGILTTYELDRIWRLLPPAAMVQQHAKDWWLVLRTESDHLDFAMPGTDLMAVVRSNQASASADRLVIGGAQAKTTAHEAGRLKYAAGQVHPAVIVDRAGRYRYDLDVVAALREVARLFLTGHSWIELAESHGHLIPAPRAANEADEPAVGRDPSKSRSRRNRNRRRLLAGKPALPYRLLEDGTPNPDWRPATIADLTDPAAALRALFLRGMSIPTSDRDKFLERLGRDLGGLHPRDTNLAFYGDGLYRRLAVDHHRSNSKVTRYHYVTADLGPADDAGYILDPDTISRLKAARAEPTHGSASPNPCAGLFTAPPGGPLYTRNGYLCPATGRTVVRTFSSRPGWGLRIWFEPHGATPHAADCASLAALPGAEVTGLLADLLEAALDQHPDSVTFTFASAPTLHDPVAAARASVDELDERHTHLTAQLQDPATPPLAADKMRAALRELENDLAAAQTALGELEADAGTPVPATYDGTFDITDVADLIALLRLRRQLPVALARRVQRLLRRLLPDAALTVDPAAGSVILHATLVLHNDQGELRVPLCGSLTNATNDPWLAGIAGAWWHRHLTFDVLFAERDLATNPGTATRWRRPIVERLLAEADRTGRPLPGVNTAGLLARAPHPALVRAVVEHVTGAAPSEPQLAAALQQQLAAVEGDPPRQLWSQPGWRSIAGLARNEPQGTSAAALQAQH